MSPPTRTATFRPPRQARSERTLERILAAAEWLTARRSFDEISVDDVVERAGASVGAFYKRFSSKDALLPSLLARVQDRQIALLRAELAAPTTRALPLGERVPPDALVAELSRAVLSYLTTPQAPPVLGAAR